MTPLLLLVLAVCLGEAVLATVRPGVRLGQWLVSNQSDGSGISTLSIADDGTYYTVIQAGQISFRASLDTGSSDSWLVSTACTTKTCLTVPRYPLSYASPTFESVNDNDTIFSLTYADGTSVSGFVAIEAIEVSNVTVSSQTFGVVTNSNISLIDEVSGVLGLGFSRLSEIYASVPDATPFFASLSQQGLLDYPIFGLRLTRNSSGSLALGGVIAFFLEPADDLQGAIDASVVQDESKIVWNEVVPFSPVGTQTNTSGYMYWTIHMTSFAVNGSALTPIPTYPGPTGNSSIALIDIGTTGLYGPYQDVTRLYALFPDSRLVDETGQWAIPCSSSAIVSLSFGDGTLFVLQPTDYLIGPTAGDPSLCLSWPKASPPSSDGIDWQLGTPFLRTVYSAWSFGIDYVQPPMIGFYPLRNASAPVEPVALVQSFFSSASATVATTLPNYLLATPTFATPPYAFNTSIPAPFGEVVTTGLATSTYLPILSSPAIDSSALPVVLDQYTLIATNAQGEVVTSIYHLTEPSATLGVPPGWTGAGTARAPVSALGTSFLVAVCAGVWIL